MLLKLTPSCVLRSSFMILPSLLNFHIFYDLVQMQMQNCVANKWPQLRKKFLLFHSIESIYNKFEGLLA